MVESTPPPQILRPLDVSVGSQKRSGSCPCKRFTMASNNRVCTTSLKGKIGGRVTLTMTLLSRMPRGVRVQLFKKFSVSLRRITAVHLKNLCLFTFLVYQKKIKLLNLMPKSFVGSYQTKSTVIWES